MKQKIALLFTLCLCSVFFMGCEKTDITEQAPDIDKNGDERTFKYEECRKLTDGEFYVNYCVQSDSENSIENWLKLDPQIRVSPYNESDFEFESNTEETATFTEKEENHPETVNDIAEVLKEKNIPEGHKLEIYYKNVTSDLSTNSRNYQNFYFTDSNAPRVYIKRSNSHSSGVYGYSKGCCWYSVGWYQRAYRILGPSASQSLYMVASNYSPYNGLRLKSYTTSTAWNAMPKYFLY